MTDTLPYSAACERNKDVILEQLSSYFDNVSNVLEIGSGTAQHALYFAANKPHLTWQTSDQQEYLSGIHAQLKYSPQSNVLEPYQLNVNQTTWLPSQQRYQAIYTANTLHIMSSTDVEALFNGLPQVTASGSYLFIYGPFKYDGEFTSPSNRDFDVTLRSRNCGSCIKDFEWVNALANKAGFELLADHAMPANNQLLIWKFQN